MFFALLFATKKQKEKLPQVQILIHVPLPKLNVPQMAVEVIPCGNIIHVFEYYNANDLASEIAVRAYGSLLTARTLKEKLGLWIPLHELNSTLSAHVKHSHVDKLNGYFQYVHVGFSNPVRTDRYLKELGRPSLRDTYLNPSPLTVTQG